MGKRAELPPTPTSPASLNAGRISREGLQQNIANSCSPLSQSTVLSLIERPCCSRWVHRTDVSNRIYFLAYVAILNALHTVAVLGIYLTSGRPCALQSQVQSVKDPDRRASRPQNRRGFGSLSRKGRLRTAILGVVCPQSRPESRVDRNHRASSFAIVAKRSWLDSMHWFERMFEV